MHLSNHGTRLTVFAVVSSLECPQNQEMPSKGCQGTKPNVAAVRRVQVKPHANSCTDRILASSKIRRQQIWRLLVQEFHIKGVVVVLVFLRNDALCRPEKEPASAGKSRM